MPGILDPRTQGLLSAGLGLMQAGGPSRMPVSLGQAIGQAGQQGLGVYNRAAEQQQNMQMRQEQMELQRMMREEQAQKLQLEVQERQRRADIQQRISRKLSGLQGQPVDVIQSSILPELFEADPMGATKMLEGIQQKIADREEKIRQFNTSLEDKRLSREQQETLRRDMMSLQAQQNAATNSFRAAQLEISRQNAETARMMSGQGKPLPTPVQNKLAEQAEITDTSERLSNTFKEQYAGYGSDALGWLDIERRKRFKQSDDTADWWSDYKRHEAGVRNKLFGSALTETERVEWQRSAPTPGQDPGLVRKNLERRAAIEKKGLERLMRSSASVYNKTQIEEITGRSLGGTAPSETPKKPWEKDR